VSISLCPAFAEPSAREVEGNPLAWLLAPGISDLNEPLRRVIPQGTTVLISGETGTGKTRLARMIHERSPRRAEPFLVVDCGVLSPHLIESELFGHVKGAFTGADCDRAGRFAAAGRGTLLLDEITSLPAHVQGKLLRAVDDRLFEPVGSDSVRPLPARLLVTSSVPLDYEVAAGRFRADLFYRLNVVAFHLPPLRQRRQAIVPLANRFLTEFAARNRPNIQALSPRALTLLERYDWPGNIRELHNTIERAAALAPGPVIHPDDLPENVQQPRAGSAPKTLAAQNHFPLSASRLAADNLTLSQGKEQVEISRITDALRKHCNNRLRAAAELGISRMSLYKKLHKYGLIQNV
jgi:two-component system response regulator HydG